VVGASETSLFISAEKEVGTAMRAGAVDESDTAAGIAKCHQPFSQQRNPDGWTVSFVQVRLEQKGQPKPSHQLSCGSPSPDSCQSFVLLTRKHCVNPPKADLPDESDCSPSLLVHAFPDCTISPCYTEAPAIIQDLTTPFLAWQHFLNFLPVQALNLER
jgi:hypothetical protein